MRSTDRQKLLQHRQHRESQALDRVAERRGVEQRAETAMRTAETRLAAETRHQQAELTALYQAIQGAMLSPARLLRMNDKIALGVDRRAARQQEVQRAAADHGAAQDATEAARAAYRASHQAVERLQALDRQLGAAEARHAEIISELESEEAATLARLARRRDHA